MRQFAALLASAVLCSLLCATAQIVVVVVEPVEGLPPEGFTPLSLDSSFSFAETNLSAILDIELFPDGRIAYAGVDKPGNITMTMGEATESGALSRPNFGGSLMVEARSVAVDARELVFYGAGVPQDPASTNLFDSPLRKIVGISDYWAWFANDNGLIGIANEVQVLPNRQILVAGRLRTFQNPEQTNGLHRIGLNGRPDTNWTAIGSANLELTTFEVLADGRVLGAFQSTNDAGNLEFGLARWGSDGARDVSYPVFLATELNARVTALQKAPGINGFLMAVQAQHETRPITRLVQLNEVGEVVESQAAETLSEVAIEGTVNAIAFETTNATTAAVSNYNRIVIGGDFTLIGTNECKNLAALTPDGIVAWSFAPVFGPHGPVEDLEVQLDGRILIGGRFTNVSGAAVNGMARLLGPAAEGAKYLYWSDSEFRAFERLGETELILRRHGGTNETLTVNVTAPDLNGHTSFQVFFGVGQDRVTAHLHFLNEASRKGRERFLVEAQPLDPAVITTRPTTEVVLLDDESPGTLSPVSFPWNRSFPSALAVQHDGRILAVIGSAIIRLHPDGTVDESFVTNGIPLQGGITEIRQIKPQANGQIYVAGKFHTTTTANPDINHVARLNSDGTLDRTFNPRLRPGSTFSNRDMAAIDVLDDGKVVIWTSGQVRPDFGLGGMFLYSEAGSLIRQYSGITPWQDSARMEHLPTGEVFAYGHVSSYSQLPKYKTNGVMDTNFVARISGQIHTMKSADGSLYLAGNLRSLNGTPVSYIAKVNAVTGELDPAFKPQLDGRVTAFHMTPAHIYISGEFTTANGIPRFRLARLNLDGTLDESFDPGVGPVQPLGFLHEENDGESMLVFAGEMFDRVKTSPIFRLESGLGSSTPERGMLEINSDQSGVIVNFSGGRLEQSGDLQSWDEVDTAGRTYRPGVAEAMRFFRVVTP